MQDSFFSRFVIDKQTLRCHFRLNRLYHRDRIAILLPTEYHWFFVVPVVEKTLDANPTANFVLLCGKTHQLSHQSKELKTTSLCLTHSLSLVCPAFLWGCTRWDMGHRQPSSNGCCLHQKWNPFRFGFGICISIVLDFLVMSEKMICSSSLFPDRDPFLGERIFDSEVLVGIRLLLSYFVFIRCGSPPRSNFKYLTYLHYF